MSCLPVPKHTRSWNSPYPNNVMIEKALLSGDNRAYILSTPLHSHSSPSLEGGYFYNAAT